MTTSLEALREATARLERFTAEHPLWQYTPEVNQYVVTVLSALQEAREALGPFADAFDLGAEDGLVVGLSAWIAIRNGVDVQHFRRAAEVYRALSPGGADE